MAPARQHFKGKYDLFTFYLVPGLTVMLASVDSWFNTNLSVLGNAGGHRLALTGWGFVTGAYYCRYTFYLFRLGRYKSPAGRALVLGAGIFLMTSVMIPYTPELYPVRAAFHVFLAFFSPILLTAALVGFLHYISVSNRRRYRSAWRTMWFLMLAALVLLILAGFINSFLEVFVVVGLCGFLRYVERLLRV